MKYISTLTALAAFFVVLGTSCHKENNYYEGDGDGDGNGNDRTVIRLSSSVEMGSLRIQDTQIAQGQELSFFVTRNQNVDSELYSNELITANGEGGFGYDNIMYYPADNSSVDFYGVHPYSSAATLGTPVSYTIAADQSELMNYLDSDVLYAERANVAPTTGAVTLQFSHKMAKLDFVIIQGESSEEGGIDISDLNEVEILNSLPSTTIDLKTGTTGAATGTAAAIIPYGIDSADDSQPDRRSGITAIIVPQTIQGRLFRMRLGDIDYFYTATGEGQTFEAGKKYTLELTINQANVTLRSTIVDWTDGGTITGDGSID